ncbi:hypothetical protein ARMGADRAFT_243873 [Armillaria gallica]|uniref:Uncharacterized protein n=1 Tax=Armillaria gallica TaxID=47427 RepID=A0A2H3E470_ARMGA|nr:hypothetical protein ARMGADRAFT_243873 [Armillaria gallica]
MLSGHVTITAKTHRPFAGYKPRKRKASRRSARRPLLKVADLARGFLRIHKRFKAPDLEYFHISIRCQPKRSAKGPPSVGRRNSHPLDTPVRNGGNGTVSVLHHSCRMLRVKILDLQRSTFRLSSKLQLRPNAMSEALHCLGQGIKCANGDAHPVCHRLLIRD